jgi:hypothetical protein
MNTDPDRHLEALFAAARAEGLRDTGRAEFGFETRLMARVREEKRLGSTVFAWAWRLCPFFAAVAVATALWSRSQLDADLIAHAAGLDEESVLVAYMTGEQR